MKKLILVLTLTFSACSPARIATSPVVLAPAACAVGSATLIDDKAAYAAEAFYNVPATAYKSAVQNGVMTPSIRAIVRPKLLLLRQYRNNIRNAHGAMSCDYEAAKALSADLMKLIPHS